MMNLGLSQLTDDQLMELLIEMCAELANRDPIVRLQAQKEIYTEANKLKDKREAMKQAISDMRKNYIKSLKEEIAQAINEQIRRGAIQVLTDKEEQNIRESLRAKHLKATETRARTKLNEEVTADLKRRIMDSSFDSYTPEEKNRLIQEAVGTATQWLKSQGTISIDAFARARAEIILNLKRMGHAEKDILKIYGKP
jgi:uncharacterized membrane-anchored protein YjiN (DUF445 family)